MLQRKSIKELAKQLCKNSFTVVPQNEFFSTINFASG
jgi:hypothetical protein